HLANGRNDKPAIVWEGEPGDQRTLTYADLYREVNEAAAVLKSLGVEKSDRVAIYLGMIPEAVVAMLACARIGATHTVIFGGFSPDSSSGRDDDCGAKVVITADGGWRRGGMVPLKDNTDKALAACPTVQKMLVVNRTDDPSTVPMQEGRDIWW